MQGALDGFNKTNNHILLSRKLEYFSENLFMIQYSQLFFTYFVEQSEISVRPQTNQSRHFITGIFNSIILCYSDSYWFSLH